MRNAKLEDGGILRLYLLKGEDFTTIASYKISKNCFMVTHKQIAQ